jgi:hypothetical protein
MRLFLRLAVTSLALLLGVIPLSAQQDKALFQTLQQLDTELFSAANRCDIEKLGTMVADDLEFYHDRDGLMRGKQAFLNAVKNNT